MFDGKAFGLEIVEAVKAYVDRMLKPIEVKLAVIEDRKPPKGDKGDPGRDGQDGQDGLGFDDLTAEYDGERTVTLRFARGEVVKTYPLVLPIVLDRGVYRPEQTYAKGDAVSFGGSLFIAQDATSSKPESGSEWRLAVKRGRDGREKANGSTAHA